MHHVTSKNMIAGSRKSRNNIWKEEMKVRAMRLWKISRSDLVADWIRSMYGVDARTNPFSFASRGGVIEIEGGRAPLSRSVDASPLLVTLFR